MPTSELSDALNPYYAQPRSRTTHVSQRPPPALQSAPQHAPHRSELELAISRQPATPPTPPITCTPHSVHRSPARSTNPHSGGVHAVQELLRFLASTREAQEIENKRRIAWEQEQEAKHRLRQAEMERRMLEMQQEIAALKARVTFSTSSSSITASVNVHRNPALPQHSQFEYAPLVSSPQQPTPCTSPTLSHPSTPAAFYSPRAGQPVAGPSTDPVPDPAEASTSASYLASPLLPPTRFVNVNPLSSLRNVTGHSAAGSDSEEERNGDDDSPPPQYRMRRKNHHDTRCLTIQVMPNWPQLIVMSFLTLYTLSSTLCAIIYCVS